MACIEVSRDEFLKAISQASDAADKQTGEMLMEVKQNKVVLIGKDTIGNLVRAPIRVVNGDANWSITIYYRRLMQVLRKVDKGSIVRMEVDGNRLVIWFPLYKGLGLSSSALLKIKVPNQQTTP